MTALRILSYQPNPRVWKATIAARLGAVELELRAASHFARLRAHPAFAPDLQPHLAKLERNPEFQDSTMGSQP